MRGVTNAEATAKADVQAAAYWLPRNDWRRAINAVAAAAQREAHEGQADAPGDHPERQPRHPRGNGEDVATEATPRAAPRQHREAHAREEATWGVEAPKVRFAPGRLRPGTLRNLPGRHNNPGMSSRRASPSMSGYGKRFAKDHYGTARARASGARGSFESAFRPRFSKNGA